MGVFKRYKDAQAAQKDAENAMPGAYQSNYTDRINEALDSMGAASNAGYDVGTDSELYRQYRAGAQANARAAAENAAAGAAALSGGYGSSYANSVAQQGYQQAMANVDSGLAGLRDKALTLYQLKQNGLSGLLSALQNQDSLEAAEHQGAVANAQDWRDYKKSRADQAAQEKSSFWSNLLDTVMNIGGALVNGYDAYKGFSRQKEQDKLSAVAQAAQYHKEGASTDFLNSILKPYGLDAGIFDDWDTGDTEEMSMSDMMSLLTQAAGVQDDGHPELAQYMLKVNNIDPSILGSYSAALYKNNNSGSSGSGRRSGSSGGSSGSRSSTGNKRPTPTYAQLLDMADDYTKMKDSDPRKTNYGNTLQYYNMIDTPNLLEKNTGLTEQSWKGDPANKWGTGTNSEKQNISDDVLNRVAGYAQRGMNGSAITVKLQHEGYSNEEIAEIFNRAGL
jgi:uncharacterized membrane protein YgcG|nr:MAG TPA: hypothetical protein [Caudoviricetes sp.]